MQFRLKFLFRVESIVILQKIDFKRLQRTEATVRFTNGKVFLEWCHFGFVAHTVTLELIVMSLLGFASKHPVKV